MGKRGVTIHFKNGRVSSVSGARSPIHFKNGRVSSVSGARSPREFKEAELFGNDFLERFKANSTKQEQGSETDPEPSDAPAEEKGE